MEKKAIKNSGLVDLQYNKLRSPSWKSCFSQANIMGRRQAKKMGFNLSCGYRSRKRNEWRATTSFLSCMIASIPSRELTYPTLGKG